MGCPIYYNEHFSECFVFCSWSNHLTSVKWKTHVIGLALTHEEPLEHTKENSADISNSFLHLLHCEDSTYNMAAQTSISDLQWKRGWIFSLLGFFPNKIQARARNLNSTGMALRI